MNTYRSEALALRTYPFAEAHRIAVFFTRTLGKVRGIAHGAQKSRSRFSGALEPLTHVHLAFSRKEQNDLVVFSGCEIIRAVPVQECTWEENLYLHYFAELLLEFTREQEEDVLLFRLSLSMLSVFRKVPIEMLARYFELWLLRLEGVLPPLQGKCSPELAGKVRRLMKLRADRLTGELLSKEEVKELESLCGDLIEYHLEKQLKSRKLLKQSAVS